MNAPNQEPPLDDLLPDNRRGRNRNDLSAIDRRTIVSFFLERCSVVDGVQKPARGTTVAGANFFDIDRTTAGKIWKTACNNKDNPDIGFYTASPQQKGSCGRPTLYVPEVLEVTLAAMP